MVRGRRRSFLDRLRPRNIRLERQAGHALEDRLAAARRLCPLCRRHDVRRAAGEQQRSGFQRRYRRMRSITSRWWQRFLIVLAGPVANFAPGDPHLRGLFRDRWDAPHAQFRRARCSPEAPPQKAGIQPGDRIESIDGQDTRRSRICAMSSRFGPERNVPIHVVRGSASLTLQARSGRSKSCATSSGRNTA